MRSNARLFVAGLMCGVLACAIAASTLAAIVLAGGFSARSKPGAMETTLARYALSHSMPARERAMQNPIPMTPETLAEARNHFADHCATCHANNGSGHTMYGDGMNPPPPDLRLPATQNKSDGELYAIIQNGVRMTGMPAFGSPGVQDESTWKLVAFIRHLPSLTADEERSMQKANPISPSELEEQMKEDEFLRGAPAQPKGSNR